MAAPVIDLVVLLVFVLLSLSKTVNGLDNQIEIDQNVKQVLNDEMEILYNKQKDEQDVDKPAAIKEDEQALEIINNEEADHKEPEDIKRPKTEQKNTLGFMHAFIAALSVIIVSEIGDKTFFIAAILSMKHSRMVVFSGALSALGCMTVLSVLLGSLTVIIPRWVTFYACTLLLALFGFKMLYEAWNMSPSEGQEEFEEVSAELKKKENNIINTSSDNDIEQGRLNTKPPFHRKFWFLSCFTPIFIQAFTLTFLAEWGDRSQLTTIILSAREDPVGVTLGGTFGHALCTALAVLGGKMISERISVRTVTFIGGIVFLVFVVTAFLHPDNKV